MKNLLKIIGFTENSIAFSEPSMTIKFRGYFIEYHDDKFYLMNNGQCGGGFVRSTIINGREFYYSGQSFDTCQNKKAKQTFLLCKALKEIEKENDYGFGKGYGDYIQRMLVSMYFSKSLDLGNSFNQASGNQEDIAKNYYKKIRKGDWWE